SKWKYWNRPKIENRNGASEKTFSYTHLLRITSRTVTNSYNRRDDKQGGRQTNRMLNYRLMEASMCFSTLGNAIEEHSSYPSGPLDSLLESS
ncbi:unnamed protein product, partial [Nesidiocoris tenuis]